jgi:hypothetical protein
MPLFLKKLCTKLQFITHIRKLYNENIEFFNFDFITYYYK